MPRVWYSSYAEALARDGGYVVLQYDTSSSLVKPIIPDAVEVGKKRRMEGGDRKTQTQIANWESGLCHQLFFVLKLKHRAVQASKQHFNIVIGLAKTIYIRCTFGIFGLNITKYTVYIYVYIRFWPTLHFN